MDRTTIHATINDLVKQYFSHSEEDFVPGKSKVPLVVPSYSWEEVSESIDSLLTTWVTMGKKVFEFERIFSQYIGTNHGLMVNSGSSANLVALSILTNPRLKGHLSSGDEVITPSCTWSTTVYPIMTVNAMPVLVDVNLGTYDISVEEIEKSITKKTRAIMPVHLLGGSCDMSQIMEIAEKHDLFVIEDTCESYGAEFKGKKVGSFGHLSTFSFFLSHHITTIEGGMLLSNSEEMMEIARPLRAHGWIREMKSRDEIISRHPGMDPRFFFWNIGFNLRPTEIQGAFGIHQMKKLESFIQIRRENFHYWNKNLAQFSDSLILHEELPGTRNVSFAYPIVVRENAGFTKKQLADFLESRGIETRPIEGANMAAHPSMEHLPYRQVGSLPNSQAIFDRGFFFGNHHKISPEIREYVVSCFEEFMRKHEMGK